MPKIKSDPDAKTVSTPAKKDTIKWCKGIVGREHVKEWKPRPEPYLKDCRELVCINCEKKFDYFYSGWSKSENHNCGACFDCLPCLKCKKPGRDCKGHRRKYPRPMNSDFRKPKSYVKH
jgi:hypothetical protein